MDLYQEDIPNVIASTNNYTYKKQKLFDIFYTARVRTTDSTTNTVQVFSSEPVFNISTTLISVNEILDRYDLCIKRMQKIIRQIEEDSAH